jgi:hypothetical protein
VQNALADFALERPAPIEPAIARPAPSPPAIRPARPATVASAVRAASSEKRGRLWSFAFGSVFGALLSLIVGYWLITSELPPAAPASPALVEGARGAELSIVVADERPAPPVPNPPVVNTSRTPAPEPARVTPAPKPPRRDVPAPALTVAREEGTSARFMGFLQIDSTPRGAHVFIDRQPVGVTPLVLTDLVVGSHAVRLEADGHTPWSSAIRITAGRQTDVSTILAPSLENESPR